MKNLFVCFLMLLIYLSGCTTNSDADFVRIDSQVLITLKEEISKSGRKLILDCNTKSTYNCLNYGIAYQFQKNSNVIDIQLTNIVEPDECSSGIGPAKAKIEMGSLAPGNYTIQILVNESVLQAPLIISQDYFRIADTSRTWIKLANPELRRIPENTIWGYVGYSSDTNVVKQVNPFLDSLTILGAQKFNFHPGDYTYFKVDSAGTITSDEDPGTPNFKPFAYIYNNELFTLRELIKRYGKNSPLSIALFSTKGDAFYTWQLANEP